MLLWGGPGAPPARAGAPGGPKPGRRTAAGGAGAAAAAWAPTSLLLPRALGLALDQAASSGRRRAARTLLEAMGPMRQRVMTMLWEVVKDAATSDPDMCTCVKRQVRSVIDGIAEDVDRQTQERLFHSSNSQEAGADSPPPTRGRRRWCSPWRCCAGMYRSFRRFALYRLSPHDKTLWGCFKDPVWWFFITCSMITFFNIRCLAFGVLLILLVFPSPADEYQLTKYIMIMKANQFLTGGMGCMMFGAVDFYWCVVFRHDEPADCISQMSSTPGALWFSILDFVGSWVLPQLAVCAFVRASRVKPAHSAAGFVQAGVEHDLIPCCCCKVLHPAPRRLRWAIRYDGTCFAFSAALMVGMTALARHFLGHVVCAPILDWPRSCSADPIVRLNMYWCRVVYAILMFPFLLGWVPDFTPVSFCLISQASRTGYNREGQCVLFRLATAAPSDGYASSSASSAAESDGSGDEGDRAADASAASESDNPWGTRPVVQKRQKARVCC